MKSDNKSIAEHKIQLERKKNIFHIKGKYLAIYVNQDKNKEILKIMYLFVWYYNGCLWIGKY